MSFLRIYNFVTFEKTHTYQSTAKFLKVLYRPRKQRRILSPAVF
ncbi:MAG: hypothetical protein ACI808_002640 [Paraglaciecola sp.]|jgi:hypothetical protein